MAELSKAELKKLRDQVAAQAAQDKKLREERPEIDELAAQADEVVGRRVIGPGRTAKGKRAGEQNLPDPNKAANRSRWKR